MRARRLSWTLVAACGLLAASAPAAQGQLLSPGPLSSVHSELEGIRNCTSCHQLGQRGISPERCLNCHEELQTRIAANRGYHATVTPNACADCHQDHLGAAFDTRRFDESTFDHGDAGYALRLSHAETECRDCHQASLIADPRLVSLMTERGALARTFLGLSTTCARCHVSDSPHGNQFGNQGCEDCHNEGEWETPPNFDHDGTSFPLEGRHADVTCSECHGEADQAVYRPLAHAICTDCHTDPHTGAMGGTCTSCHSTTGWTNIASGSLERVFNHATTRFPLVGAHAPLECRACHVTGRPPRTALLRMTYAAGTQNQSYPRPLFDTCRSCHVDQHTTATGEVRWTDCESCHSDTRWAPSPFDLARHAASDFSLTGSHLVTPCVGCHQNPDLGQTSFTLSVPGQTCEDCHRADDPHGDTFAGSACADCHNTDAFQDALFDHARFLDGPTPQACTTCHSDEDPHQGQFPDRDCGSCHVTEAFTIESFDHGATAFPLDGAHAPAPCASCHRTEAGSPDFVRYRPLGTECVDCHAGGI
jgi:hypothetical protein